LERLPDEQAGSPLASARQLIYQDKYAEAETALRSYLTDHQASADARFLLAYSLFREDKAKDSLNEYTHASRLRTPTAEDLRYVALDYVLLNDYADADKWMSQSLAWNDKDFETWYGLGRIRYTENLFQDAVRCFAQALTLNPKSVKAENNLGLTYQALNRTGDAVAAYRQAIAWQQASDQPSEQPLLNLATVLVDRDQLDQALPLLQQAVAIAPRDAKIREQLGRLYFRKQQWSQSQTEFEEAVSLEPDSAPLHFLLGQAYRRDGNTAKANAEFARAAALNGAHSTPPRN
jgi:Flp pilus assembly protein TadD